MIHFTVDFAVGAVAGAVAAVVSQKVYNWVKAKIVAVVEAKAAEIVAAAKKSV